ncbi:hypothetical protein [Lentzea albida]|uniref:hypothetical protein n=1 Tax=Lentzea albida TaxID=65499 RepID=UPI0011602480|nr:hypothetical protein [Lentzea albida]
MTARLLDKSALLVVTLGLAAKAYNIPSKQFWDSLLQGRGYVSLVLLGLAGVFGALTPFESYHKRSMLDRTVTMRRRILAAFGRMLEISGKIQPPLDTGDLAMHFWRKKRTFRHPVSGVLTRVSTYRMSTHPLNRKFAPQRGVGVVGLCWQFNKEVHFDVGPLIATLATEQEFNDHVQQQGSESVMNLSWKSFNEFRHRTALLATPIRNGRNRFIGCVSVDASRGFDVLCCRALIEEMTELGLAIGQENFECT